MRLCIKSSLTVAIKHHSRAIVAFLLIATSSAAIANDALNQYTPLGHHRLLVLCLQDNNNAQSAKLGFFYDYTDWDGFSERDLFFVEMRKDSLHLVKGQMVLNPETGHEYVTWKRVKNTSDNQNLRRVAACNNDLELVLIGNDGTQKMRWKDYIPPKELFDRIDSMPFRQLEIRRQNKWR